MELHSCVRRRERVVSWRTGREIYKEVGVCPSQLIRAVAALLLLSTLCSVQDTSYLVYILFGVVLFGPNLELSSRLIDGLLCLSSVVMEAKD